ncbi:Alkaline ceramidase 3 [Smittium culicis]|uniref:Alkaline ceramidase 3 n=1 Tax=Smittium culicis TaxID=133412 RepID=A0A1R1XNH5_9FUNG|nr:Alkaline ceramidase 3 [Smittium culicis]
MDELPMIYVTSTFLYLLIETEPEIKYGHILPSFIILLNLAITIAYIYLLNPVFHQVSFGLVITYDFYKSYILLSKLPNSGSSKKQLKSLLIRGFFSFLIGFAAWNLDNICCKNLRTLRLILGPPFDALLQMHGWWHILTAYAAHCLATFVTALRFELSNTTNYSIRFLFPGVPLISFNTSNKNEIKKFY